MRLKILQQIAALFCMPIAAPRSDPCECCAPAELPADVQHPQFAHALPAVSGSPGYHPDAVECTPMPWNKNSVRVSDGCRLLSVDCVEYTGLRFKSYSGSAHDRRKARRAAERAALLRSGS